MTFDLLLQPHLTSCCRQNLSVEVVNRLQREEKTCPYCRASKWSTELNEEFQRKVQRLRVFCPHVDNGCEWEGQLKRFERHIRSCPMGHPLETTRLCTIMSKYEDRCRYYLASLPDHPSPRKRLHTEYYAQRGRESLGIRLNIDRVTYIRIRQRKTKLHEAAEKGDVEAVEKLLTDTSININSPTEMVRLHP